jgi:hypothetical protein
MTGGRLTLGSLPATPSETVRYAFTSMTAPAGTVSPRIGVSGSPAGGDYSVALGLGMEHEGEIWALADKPVTLGGVTVPADDTGSAVFELGTLARLDGLGLSPSVPLADGRYVLTVQLFRDGTAVGRASAAPLLVRTPAPGSGGGTPGAPAPGTSAPGTTPGGGAGGGAAPGGTSPGTGTQPAPGTQPGPGTPPTPGSRPSGPAPPPGGQAPSGGPTPVAPAPGTTTPPSAPGTPAPKPGAPAPVPPAPGAPGTGTPPGSTTPGGPLPGPGTTPGTGGGSPAPTTPGDDTTTYPGTGTFGITSLSPNTVTVDGGTLVTVKGTALPARPRILVGGTAQATVVQESATRIQFRVPARVAGVHDVAVFAPDGRWTVLSGALTYRASAPAGGGPGPGSTPAPGGSTPPGSTPPGRPLPGTPGPGTPPGPGAGSVPVERTGPSGERLVRSATFAALRGIWSVDCSSSCTGVAI